MIDPGLTIIQLSEKLAAAKTALKKVVGSSPRNFIEALRYNLLPEAKTYNEIERAMTQLADAVMKKEEDNG